MDQRLRILTLNTWKCDGAYEDRLEWMADALCALAPDIVCLQEAFLCPETKDDTAAFLALRLSMNLEVLAARKKSRRFKGRDRLSWSNLAILSRRPMTRAPDLKLAEIERDADRWAMHVQIEAAPGRVVSVINTHFTHIRGYDGDGARKAQSKQIADLCQKIDSDAAIICGDLNAEPDADSLKPLLRLNLASPPSDDATGTFHGERAGSIQSPRKIDFIEAAFTHKETGTLLDRRPALNQPVGPDGEFPSDHAALLADILLARSTAAVQGANN